MVAAEAMVALEEEEQAAAAMAAGASGAGVMAEAGEVWVGWVEFSAEVVAQMEYR